MASNPILAEVTRGGIVESFHRGALIITGKNGEVICSRGNVENQIFPRSAIKAMQAIPLIASGAAHKFDLSDQEIAIACSSHGGEIEHINTVRSLLRKAKIDEAALMCGSHWPLYLPAGRDMAKNNQVPDNIHNNCSGKHAGMLATAKHLGEPLEDYINRDHPVQKRIEKIISGFYGLDLTSAPCGIDGCSVPTWAISLKAMAFGFSNFSVADHNENQWADASSTIIKAARSFPLMIAGSERFCTRIMKAVPRLFAKTGAEGVYCGCIPHAGIGIAVKCDDGAKRASEVIFAKALSSLDVWSNEERRIFEEFSQFDLKNSNEIMVGQLQAC